MTDRIVWISADDEVAVAIDNFRDYVMSEVLAVAIERKQESEASFEKWEINGHPAELKVIREK